MIDKKPPPRFTGKHGERYYYKGARWFGPTNMIGARPMTPIQPEYPTGPWGLTVLSGEGGAHYVDAHLAPRERAPVMRNG